MADMKEVLKVSRQRKNLLDAQQETVRILNKTRCDRALDEGRRNALAEACLTLIGYLAIEIGALED